MGWKSSQGRTERVFYFKKECSQKWSGVSIRSFFPQINTAGRSGYLPKKSGPRQPVTLQNWRNVAVFCSTKHRKSDKSRILKCPFRLKYDFLRSSYAPDKYVDGHIESFCTRIYKLPDCMKP